MRRLYVQAGKVIANSKTNISGMKAYDSIINDFCADQKVAFGAVDDFKAKGGFGPMSTAMGTANMLWLDSSYPLDKDAATPGVARGACPTSFGVPADVESQSSKASVTYSNIKFGPIGSTYTQSA